MQQQRINKLLTFLEQEPNDPFLIYALATEYNAAGYTQQALALYIRLTQQHADYVGTYYHLGKLHEAMGNKKEAEEVYQQGMKQALAKGDGHAYRELQNAYNVCSGITYNDEDDEDY